MGSEAVKPVIAVGQRWKGRISTVEWRIDRVGDDGLFDTTVVVAGGGFKLGYKRSWESSAFDNMIYLGGPPSPSGEPVPPQCCERDCTGAGGVACTTKPAPAPVAAPRIPPQPFARPQVPASCLMERWNETGPLTALQAIQARKKPEPYIPSIDDWDLLPDAGR